ncbi:MAG: tetratricopeptide repeat protein [Flavobacteriia bacterium]
MNRLLVLLLMCLPIVSFSQTSEKYNSEYENFYRAEELFEKEQYGAARIEFRNFINGFPKPNDPMYLKALYYEGLSALELFNNDAVPLLEDFNKNYPESIYKNEIYFRLGKYFYQKKDYRDALVWFNKLRDQDVEVEQREEYYFKLGYANFQEENLVAARSAFHEVKEGVTQYAAPGLYYYSHIAYLDKSYQTALDGFIKLQNDDNFKNVVPYYIAQIYYLQGKYREVTEYAPAMMDSSNIFNKNDMNHLIGDSYYRTGKYDEAVPYLEAYNEKSNTTREDDYQLGYSYYRSGSFEKAIRIFDKVARQKDSLGQVALYHIGESYLQQKNLISARSAFEAASEIDKDPKVQEDALYNYAVLSYKLDINPYDEAVIALEKYLNRYPNSARKNDVNQYLVNVYTSTNNYAKALASLDKLPNKDTKLKTAYQLVAFNQGVEFFQKAEFQKAIKSFELVDKYPVDPLISGKAKFWTADCHFRLNQMDLCIKGFKDYLSMPSALGPELKADAYYNLGYAYLKKQDMAQSIESFRIYCQSNVKNKNKLADAYMRAADGYYITKQNENAIKHYQLALDQKAGFEDQALFYMAKSYGFSDKEDQKLSRLLDIINNYKNSKYILQSVYEVAISYKAKSDYDKSLRYFNQVTTDYPNSVLVVPSKIEIADIYYKKWDYSRSELEYKKILTEFGEDREVCEKCVRGLVDVYAALKQPEKASQIASEYACANITVDEQEGLFYSPAIEAYQDSAYASAIPSFEKYLERFPSGKYVVDAQFYLANSYYATGKKEKAIETYRKLLEGPNNSYTEFSASRVAQHLYNGEKYEEAIPYYDRLEKISSKPAVLFNAKLGLMRCNFYVENWTNAAVYAKSVLTSSQINNTLRLEAEYANGMSKFYLNNYSLSLPSLDWITKNTTTVMAAEAKYSIAEIHYKQEDYTKSDTEIRALIKMKPSYNYWVAKGLILQTRILMLQDDLFQAEQTLKSVIDHYPDEDDGILAEANELWDELMQLKNQPKSVQEEEETVIEVNEEGGN